MRTSNDLLFILPILIPIFIGLIISYVIMGLAYSKLVQKAGLQHETWKAWVPILQTVLFFHMIDRSGWNMLLMLVPFVNAICIVIWYIDFLKRFGQSPLWLIAFFLPGTNLIFIGFLIYMAFSEEVRYVSTNKYQMYNAI